MSNLQALELFKLLESTVAQRVVLLHDDSRLDQDAIGLSKIGGTPFCPKKRGLFKKSSYPTDSEGKPLFLLTQLNFVDAPKFSPFPLDGILQFYIRDDEYYGLNLDDPFDQSGFRVVYIPYEDTFLDHDPKALPKFTPREDFPVNRPVALYYTTSHQTPEPDSELFESTFLKHFDSESDQGEFIDYYCKYLTSPGDHQIGGYPNYIQGPAPFYAESKDNWILLLQLSSQNDVMFGDAGNAYFFIKKENLEKLDFSEVLYHWDCC